MIIPVQYISTGFAMWSPYYVSPSFLCAREQIHAFAFLRVDSKDGTVDSRWAAQHESNTFLSPPGEICAAFREVPRTLGDQELEDYKSSHCGATNCSISGKVSCAWLDSSNIQVSTVQIALPLWQQRGISIGVVREAIPQKSGLPPGLCQSEALCENDPSPSSML